MIKRLLEYLLILDLSYFLFFGIYYKSAVKLSLAIGAAIYILIKIAGSGKKFFSALIPATFLNKAIFIFLGVAFLSVVLGQNFAKSQAVFFQRYIYYFSVFFFAAYLAKDKKHFAALITIFLASTFIVALGGLKDLMGIGFLKAYENLPSQVTRLYTSFKMSAFFAAYFLYSLPIFIIILLLSPRVKLKILSAIAIIPLFICLFFHFSRSTWIVLSLAVLIYFLFIDGHKWMGVFVAYLIISVIFILQPLRERLFSPGTLSPASWGDRVTMWKAAENIFKEFPFFGVGPGNYASYMYKAVPAGLYKEGFHHLHAHDTYLEILSETGFIGLISFLFIFFVFFKIVIPKLKNKEDYINVGFLVMVIAVLLGELTASTIMVGVYNAFLFWFLMGLAVGRQEETQNA